PSGRVPGSSRGAAARPGRGRAAGAPPGAGGSWAARSGRSWARTYPLPTLATMRPPRHPAHLPPPLGVTEGPDGPQLAVLAAHADAAEVCLFGPDGTER